MSESVRPVDSDVLNDISDKLQLDVYGPPGTPYGDKIAIEGGKRIAFVKDLDVDHYIYLVGLTNHELRWLQLPYRLKDPYSAP